MTEDLQHGKTLVFVHLSDVSLPALKHYVPEFFQSFEETTIVTAYVTLKVLQI